MNLPFGKRDFLEFRSKVPDRIQHLHSPMRIPQSEIRNPLSSGPNQAFRQIIFASNVSQTAVTALEEIGELLMIETEQ